jgi:PEP-CTERM motif
MNTKMKLAATTLLAGLAFNNASYASIVVVDDFSTNHAELKDTNIAIGTDVSSTVNLINLQPNPATLTRTLSHDLIASTGTIDSAARVAFGALEAINGSGENSIVNLEWDIKTDVFGNDPATAAFLFNVIDSDLNPVNISFSFKEMGGSVFNALPQASFDITNAHNTPLAFVMNATDLGIINKGGILKLNIAGVKDWDLTLDMFGFDYTSAAPSVPEPGMMGVLTLSLAGLGLMRRKKAVVSK